MKTNLKLIPIFCFLSFGLAACNKDKSQDLDKAREARHDTRDQLNGRLEQRLDKSWATVGRTLNES